MQRKLLYQRRCAILPAYQYRVVMERIYKCRYANSLTPGITTGQKIPMDGKVVKGFR